jgi:hypothetical protein
MYVRGIISRNASFGYGVATVNLHKAGYGGLHLT